MENIYNKQTEIYKIEFIELSEQRPVKRMENTTKTA